jgi:hypothetical protein
LIQDVQGGGITSRALHQYPEQLTVNEDDLFVETTQLCFDIYIRIDAHMDT